MQPDHPSSSLFADLLGAAFYRLSPLLARVHDDRPLKRFEGRCEIRCGTRRLAKILARMAQLPMASPDVPVQVTIARDEGCEVWLRRFGEQPLRSVMKRDGTHLVERLGLFEISFELIADTERIAWQFAGARLVGVRLPTGWLLECAASETIEAGCYRFDASARLRGIGLLVHYRGWLTELDH